jgi:ParB family chromosome partitioning protein
MALKDRPKVDLSHIGLSSGRTGQGAKTAIGLHADALFRDEKVTAENVELKERLAQFDGANPARQIDAKLILVSKWANRHEKSFSNDEFEGLKTEIESAGGNIQAIKIRPHRTLAGQFEVVFGHRRHRACLELGLPVLAVVEELSDAELFCQMDRENRERADLRPFEAGMSYARALDEGLFPSAKKLAEAASLDLSQLGKALALARLPLDVINAFPSPLELQYRWAPILTQALQKDPEIVLTRAKQLQNQSPRPAGAKVLSFLVEGGGTVPPPHSKRVSIKGKNGQKGDIKMDAGKRTAIVNLSNIDPSKFAEVERVIKALIS